MDPNQNQGGMGGGMPGGDQPLTPTDQPAPSAPTDQPAPTVPEPTPEQPTPEPTPQPEQGGVGEEQGGQNPVGGL